MALQEFARSIPQYINNVAADKKIVLTKNERDKILKLFLGFYSSTPTEFRFKPGEIVLVSEIVEIFSRNYSDTSETAVNDKTLSCDTVNTAIGLLFGHNSKKKKNTAE